ncbi:MAG: arsenate reductase (glutaredoxin) [Bacteroidota bacterium]
MSFIIYHNPRCRKSRESLQILEKEKVEIQVREYLKEPISTKEFKVLLAKLNLNIKEIIRKEERVYKEKYKDKTFTDDEWISILIEEPKLIQRPIVVKENKAVIGRPPENVKTLF